MKNKMKKRVLAGACALMMVASSLSSMPARVLASKDTTVQQTSTDDLKLWYNSPAGITSYSDWEKWSLPIGNGGIGGSVFGGITRERIQLNEKSLWSGGPSESRKDYNGGNIESKGQNGAIMKQVQEAFKNGNSSKASSLCSTYLVGVSDDAGTNGYGYYLSFGNMYLDFKGVTESNVTDYRRDLDLRTAIASVEYTNNGTKYVRENFTSYPDNVIVTHITAEGNGTIDLDVSVAPDNQKGDGSNNPGESSYSRTWDTTVSNGLLSINGQLTDNQMMFTSQTQVLTDESGTVADGTDKVIVSGAKEVTIITSMGTNYKNVYPTYRTEDTQETLAARIQGYVTKAATQSYETLRQTHVEDYDEIFGRVELDLGQEVSEKTTNQLLTAYNNGTATTAEKRYLEVMLFQYGRYLTIESSRETPEDDPYRETLPSNLQGMWVGANNSAWHSDYHMNVNLQMNYWPTYSTNMAECAEPLVAYVDSLREPGRVTASIYAGITSGEGEENGFMAHTQNNPFGWTCPGWDFSWGWSPAAVPWILQNCWAYYEYTGDVEYLRDNIYPMMKEEAILYDQMLIRDEDGYLVSSPAFSPEHGPITSGNTYEQTLIWQLYEDTIKAAEILNVDVDLVETWKANQADLKGPIEIGDDGQIKEWYTETTLNSVASGASEHRHISHMLGLFPGDLISVETPEWLEAAKVSMSNRVDKTTGWGMGQRINTWARLGDGNHAYKLIGDLFSSGILTNLWDTHSPYQIDGNFGYTSGVSEMLLQSNVGYINLLPALPDAWADGSVDGLVAQGNFEVSMDWTATNLTKATILSNNGGECIVNYATIQNAKVVNSAGQEVEFTKVDGTNKIKFDTTAGETYTITEIPEKPLEAPENVNAIQAGNVAVVSFDAVANATEYNVYVSTDGTEYTKVTTIQGTEYKDTEYTSGKTYKIAAVGKNGEGTMSDAITPEELTITDKIDDRDERIKYSGWGNWGPQTGQYLETEKYSTTPGDEAEFYFYGNTIRVIGMKNTDCGKFDLYIDDELVADDVNTQSSSCQRQQVLVEKNNLTEGIHKVKIVVVTSKVSLDAFEFEIGAITATGLEIVGDSAFNINATKTLQLTANYKPSGATGEGVNWTVDNESIATIDANGLLTAKKAGTVVVIATDKTNTAITATKEITITNDPVVTRYDDQESGITYTGDGWVSWGDDRYHAGTGHEVAGDTVNHEAGFKFSFEGTGISLYGMKLVYHSASGTAGALIDVIIDGQKVDTVDTLKESGDNADPQQKWFEKLDLENTTHTIEVKLAGLSEKALSQGATKPKIAFDFYEVTVAEVTKECEHATTELKNAKEATCTEAGYTGDEVCTECKETVKVGTTIQAKGHSFATDFTVDKEATCTEAGSKSKHCANCDATTEVTAIAAKGHSFATEFTVDKEATCTEAGSKSKHCANCDATTEVTAIAAKGHDYGAWETVTEPTVEKEGLKTHVCKTCNHEETEVIARLAAKEDKQEAQEYLDACVGYYTKDNFQTEEEWTAYQEAVKVLEEVLAKEDLTTDELQAAIDALESSIPEVSDPSVPSEPEQPDTEEPSDKDDKQDSVQTGDAASVMMWAVLFAMAAVVVVMKKRTAR